MNIDHRLKPETITLIDDRLVACIRNFNVFSDPGQEFPFQCFWISTVMKADIVVMSEVSPGIEGIQRIKRFFPQVGRQKIKVKMRINRDVPKNTDDFYQVLLRVDGELLPHGFLSRKVLAGHRLRYQDSVNLFEGGLGVSLYQWKREYIEESGIHRENVFLVITRILLRIPE